MKQEKESRGVPHPLYRGTWFPTCALHQIKSPMMKFQSAISRYLVSNLSKAQIGRQRKSFNPLYRGTWFPTPQNLDIDVQVRTSFNPLYRGTWFPTLSSKQTGCTSLCGFNPLYRGTWFPTGNVSKEEVKGKMFQSAISRYLVSNQKAFVSKEISFLRFNPLYRGTWFPTPLY